LHLRLFLDYIEISDEPHLAASNEGLRADGLSIPYSAGGERRVKVFEKLDRPIWQDWVDFGGMPIPLWLLEEMKAAEGAREEWYNRGVHVGDIGWEVLEKWTRNLIEKATRELKIKKKKKSDVW
jgi:hypothetical protein